MSFSIQFRAESKEEAMHKVESAGLPTSVKSFLDAAIHGFIEKVEGEGDAAKHTPTPISVSASGHLDAAGGKSSCTISVSAA